jgi:hypothetical protein
MGKSPIFWSLTIKNDDKTADDMPIPAFSLKSAVERIKIPFALSLSKGGRGFDRLTQWVGMWKPLMVRQAHHERFPHTSTDFFRFSVVNRSENVSGRG